MSSPSSTSKPKRRKVDSKAKSVISDGDAHDDKAGLVKYKKDDLIYKRYRIVRASGQGTFGTVLYCIDEKRKRKVAVKVVRSVRRYLEAADVEIKILEKIMRKDQKSNSLCVRLRKSFMCHYNGQRHKFLVFEKLGCSLFDFVSKNSYRGFSLLHVKEFAFQMIKSVKFCHSIDLVHTDLKPENILFVDDDYYKKDEKSKRPFLVPKSTQIKLIDFGGATFINEHHARIINTRQYRSPEVILGIGWGFPSDLWSIGCILAELYTGELLFGTHDNAEHLALIETVLETAIPSKMADRAVEIAVAQKHRKSRRVSRRRKRSCSETKPMEIFDGEGRLRWPAVSKNEESREAVQKCLKLSQIARVSGDDRFEDLMRRLLCVDPERRITCAEAIVHPFFDSINKNIYR